MRPGQAIALPQLAKHRELETTCSVLRWYAIKLGQQRAVGNGRGQARPPGPKAKINPSSRDGLHGIPQHPGSFSWEPQSRSVIGSRRAGPANSQPTTPLRDVREFGSLRPDFSDFFFPSPVSRTSVDVHTIIRPSSSSGFLARFIRHPSPCLLFLTWIFPRLTLCLLAALSP